MRIFNLIKQIIEKINLIADYPIEVGTETSANAGFPFRTRWRKWKSGKLEVWQTDFWTFSNGYTIALLAEETPKFAYIGDKFKQPTIHIANNYRSGYTSAGVVFTPSEMQDNVNGSNRQGITTYARIGSSLANGKHWLNIYCEGYWK